jgi:tetratricopeptide (TPR) repeat protein
MAVNRIRVWIGPLILAGVLTSAVSVMAQTGGVTGTVKGTDGKKLAGYPILIQRMDIKSTYKTKTNKHGSFVYIGLPIADYKVTLEDPSGHPLTYVEKHIGMGDPTPVDFDLSKMQGMAQHLAALKQQKQSQALMQAFNQANNLFEQKNYEAAAAAFAKAVPLASGKNVGVVQAHEALAYYEAGQYDKAIPIFQQAVASDPKNQALHGALAQAYVKTGDIKDAEREYKAAGESVNANQLQAAQKAAKSNEAFKNLKGAFDSATQLYNEGQYAQAAAAYDKAAQFAKGKNLNVVLQREADSYDKAHQYPQAVAAYQKAMQADPTDANLENSLGSVYAHMGNTQAAMQQFQKAAQMDPPHAARFYFNMGAVMTNAGKMDDAAAAFKKCTELDPTFSPDAYFLEAQALLSKATTGANGKVNPAPGTVEALQNYLKYAPNGKYAASAQQMLQALTGKVQTTYKRKRGSGS